MTGATIRRVVAISVLAFGLALVAGPAFAQSGQIKGKVTDAQGNPVVGASIALENTNNGGRPIVVKTDKKGEYIQVGLPPGDYKVTATKDALTVTKDTHVGLDMVTFDIKLVASAGGGGGGVSKEEAARNEKINAAFSQGVQFSKDGKFDEAVAKFQEVATAIPTCAECYLNIGLVQMNAKKYDEAVAALNKSIELKPTPEAYQNLATVLNTQKKFSEAEAAGKKAMELSAGTSAAGAGTGASASAAFNQGVILWNANKYAEAKTQFESAVKADPNLAEAHYWLGMALVNSGDMAGAKPHFETYLKLAPTGQYADTAKSIVASIK